MERSNSFLKVGGGGDFKKERDNFGEKVVVKKEEVALHPGLEPWMIVCLICVGTMYNLVSYKEI